MADHHHHRFVHLRKAVVFGNPLSGPAPICSGAGSGGAWGGWGVALQLVLLLVALQRTV